MVICWRWKGILTPWCETEGKRLKWQMKTESDFVIFVGIQTVKGHRYIIYTSAGSNGRGYYGLGESSADGKWHSFSRDLDLDLRRFEPTNQIIAFNIPFLFVEM